MSFITMVEAPQSPSLLAALVLQNSLRHISVDLKIKSPLNPPLVLPTTTTTWTRLTGEQDPDPHPVNLTLDSGDCSIPPL
jgi:hypothetical protein